MKLIDILAEELPKRGGWPDGAVFVAQEEGGGLWSFTSKPQKDCDDEWMDESHHGYHTKVGKLREASDHDISTITREQYEAALAAKNDGWIEWGGGKCPLHHGVIIDAKDRDGYIHYGEVVGKSCYIDDIFWRRGTCAGEDNEIIAYRLHQPQEAEQAEADDEADLNECIGQDVAPVWNGDGAIPPVGCVCERSWAGDEWQSCKILFASGQIVVVKLKESGREDAYNIGDVTFRPILPIRSEADRKRDEAVKAITLTGWCQTAAEEIYDLIAAGKVPGMKLED